MSGHYDWDIVETDASTTDADAAAALGRVGAGGHEYRFTSRADAEEYLGENWRRLAACGVRSVRLAASGDAGDFGGSVVPLVAGE